MSHSDFILDKRVVARNISKGLLTQKDLEDSLAKLTDVADNAMVSRPEGPEDDAAEGETAEPTEPTETTDAADGDAPE